MSAAVPTSIRQPPQAPPLFSQTAQSLISNAETLIAEREALRDSIVRDVSVQHATFSNVLLPLAQNENITLPKEQMIMFMQLVSTDENIRDASTEAEQKMEDYEIEASMREDVFKLVEAVYHQEKDVPSLDPESKRLLEKDYQRYMRMGLGLTPGPERDRFKEIQKRLSDISIECSKNIQEETGGLWFSPEELHGVPNDVLETLAKGEEKTEEEGKLRLTFKRPDLIPVLKHCSVAETRRKMFLGDENKSNQNIPLFQELLVLRDESAHLLGFPNHAAFVLEENMFRTPTTVNKFLDNLRERLSVLGQKELQRLKGLKKSDTGDSDHYYLWDHQYYDALMLSRDFNLDQNKIAEYFPLQSCITGMLAIFEGILGLAFIELKGEDRNTVSETGRGDDIIWHPDVHLFSVWDDVDNGGGFVGYLYMDLHPRDGKFGHALNINLIPGCDIGEGKRQYPVTVLLCNFSKPTTTKPSLLKHHEVVTMFHELGHGIHNLVSRTTYARFHGTNTVGDFVEAPSQMLENWCWTSSQIKSLSRHWSYLSPDYEKAYIESNGGVLPEEKMPDAMIRSIVRTRHVNSALSTLRQLHFGIFDQMVHQPISGEEIATKNFSKLWNTLRRDICQYDDLGDVDDYYWANGQASFEHIIGGYSAGYYSYLASQAYSADMFDTAFSKDPMNRESGHRYRRIILEPGGSREASELLKEFLGREPSNEAFHRQLGLA